MLRRNIPPPLDSISPRPLSADNLSHLKSPSLWRGAAEPRSPGAISTASFISSFSWVAEKSSAELASLLKNAYTSLREKERDLALAAEIGKSLLENNTTLKSKYEEVLERMQQYEQDSRQQSDDAACCVWDDGCSDSTANSDAMRLISNQRARDTLIEALERKNSEMQAVLDSTLRQSAETSQANEKATRKLQHEIDLLRSSLDVAAQKVQELEDARHTRLERARHMQHCSNDGKVDTPLCNIQERLLEAEELAARMTDVQTENDQLVSAKHAVESKLQSAMSDLQDLRQQFAQFQCDQQGYSALKDAYIRQFKHIEELTASLEDHRVILSRLRDRGIGWSPCHSPSPSECGKYHCTAVDHMEGSVSLPALNKPLSSNTLQADLRSTAPKQSLLCELENEWLKRLQQPASPESLPDNVSSMSSSAGLESHTSSDNDIVRPSVLTTASAVVPLKDVASLTEQNLASLYNTSTQYALEVILSCAALNDSPTVATPTTPTPTKKPASTAGSRKASVVASSVTQRGFEQSSFRGGSSSVYSAFNLYPRVPSDFLAAFDCRYHYSSRPRFDKEPGLLLTTEIPCSFVGFICWAVRCIFHVMWRWCRFSVVLLTAIIINLWHGPDAILEKS